MFSFLVKGNSKNKPKFQKKKILQIKYHFGPIIPIFEEITCKDRRNYTTRKCSHNFKINTFFVMFGMFK